jgi:hypothetical protein
MSTPEPSVNDLSPVVLERIRDAAKAEGTR